MTGARVFALCVGMALAVVVVRVYVDGRAALAAGDRAMAAGKDRDAIAWYLEAGRMYVPGGVANRRGVENLAALGTRARAQGDDSTARRAWEAVRSAALGTRWLVTPYEDLLLRANAELAGLYARSEAHANESVAEQQARIAWHAERMAARPGPAVGWTLAALVGLVAWLASVLLFILRGLDQTLRLRRGPAALAACGFVMGFALFVIGLRLA